MPIPTADELVTQKHVRAYIQLGGPRPSSAPKYYGQDYNYMSITGVGLPESGNLDPIWVHDPSRQGKYRLTGRKISPPDLAKATLNLYEKHGSIPRALGYHGCQFNLYEAVGVCHDLSDFLGGWSDYVLVYSGAIVTEKDLGDRSTFDSDDAIKDALTLTLADIYPIGGLNFGDNALTMVDLEVVDVVYGSRAQCGNCGPEDDGSNRAYAVVKSSGSGSPGLPTEVIYTVNGGGAWAQQNITGMGVSEDPVAIDIVGQYLVVVSKTAGGANDGGYYYALIDANTGVPGTWTKVTSGFTTSKAPNDLYVASPREIWFCGDGGYIYKSTNITQGVSVINDGAATVQNLNRIKGSDEVIVSVGAAGAIVKSANRGVTWAALTGPNAVAQYALEVIDQYNYWIGGATAYLWNTENGGATWTEFQIPGGHSGNIYDIVAATREVIHLSHSTTTPTARLLTTWNGGVDWATTAPRVLNWPVCNKINRFAVPQQGTPADIIANTLLAGGLSASGTDGILLLGVASRF